MIKYLAIIDSSNNPILVKSTFEASYIEQVIYSYLDILNLTYQMSNISGQMGQLGYLDGNNVIYGFMTMTSIKLFLIVDQNEKRAKQFLRSIFEIYITDSFNPFQQRNLNQKVNKYIENISAQ